jgi:hypothetical protein
LLRSPFDEVVHVATFLTIEETEAASRPTRAPTVSNDVDVATGDEEIAGTSFDESGWGTKILNLPWIGGGSNQHGILTGFSRTMHIRQQHNPVPHWHSNVVIVCHDVSRL